MNKTNVLKVGEIFHNENGEDYTIVYVNEELNRALLISPNGLYIAVWDINCSKGCWSQGHYFLKDFEGAVNYVLGKEAN